MHGRHKARDWNHYEESTRDIKIAYDHLIAYKCLNRAMEIRHFLKRIKDKLT